LTEEKQRKKKKKQKQIILLKQKATESQKFSELLETLEGLEKEQKHVDVQICPHCKSPRIRRVGTMSGDMSGHMGLSLVKFECLDCSWRERLVVKATNRKLGVKQVAIIAEARDLKEKMNFKQ
jgi:RNase P subunit RPR2